MSIQVSSAASAASVAPLMPRRAGWVKTDMGGPDAHLSVEQSCDALAELFVGLTEDKNGCFLNYDGSELAW